MYTPMSTYTCLCVCMWRPEVNLSCLILCPCPYFWDKASHWAWNSLTVETNLRELSVCLLEVIGECLHARLLPGCCGSEPTFSCIDIKPRGSWVISPVCVLHIYSLLLLMFFFISKKYTQRNKINRTLTVAAAYKEEAWGCTVGWSSALPMFLALQEGADGGRDEWWDCWACKGPIGLFAERDFICNSKLHFQGDGACADIKCRSLPCIEHIQFGCVWQKGVPLILRAKISWYVIMLMANF